MPLNNRNTVSPSTFSFILIAILALGAFVAADHKLLGTVDAKVKDPNLAAEAPAGNNDLPTVAEKHSERIEESATSPSMLPTAVGPVKFDFDGDGIADIGRWHAATSEFRVIGSQSGLVARTIGSSTARVAPGDFDGSGTTDIAVFNAGTWTIKSGLTDTDLPSISFGQGGDIPVAADYDGDGVTDAAIVRPSTNTWWVRQSTNSAIVPYSAGGSGDIPVPGNYDTDTKTDIALYRPSTGVWTIAYSTGGTGTFTWGNAGTDIPVPADYDGDGKTDLAIYRRSTGTWYIVGSTVGWIVQTWGYYGDQPVPADYDGDGKADLSVWRPTTGIWHMRKSNGPTFDEEALGVAGDTAVPSAYIKQIGGTVSPFELAQSRLSPKNATGGTDLYSRNFSWGRSLIDLPGRAGLNASLGISYNSLIWTKSGSEVHFDADTSNVSPGFRLGFPTIEPAYFDSKTGNFAYLMVTPSGGRVEFRQVAATNTYETADSTYVELKTNNVSSPNVPVDTITITVTGTDGTQMTYAWKGGAFRCSKIKDRNGNFMTVVHNDYGQLETVTDTLGRVIKVEYDANGYPTSIKQAWGSGTNGSGPLYDTATPPNWTNAHTWATFTYNTKEVNTDFDGSLSVIGPPNTTYIKVLEKITYADLSSTKFEYNGYGQVYKVENYSPNSTSLNYVRTTLQTPNANQFDSPKFTATWTWAKYFNNNAEVETNNSITSAQSYSVPGGLSGTGARVDVWITGHPNNLLSRSFVSESGWSEGLPVVTEEWTEGTGGWARQRWSWTNYTQDNASLNYPLNPRVIESRVGDGTNTKKTVIEYQTKTQGSPVAKFGLVKKIEIGDLSTVFKISETDYNLSSEYVSKHIIGLPAETRMWGRNDLTTNLEFVSKTLFAYDEGGFGDTLLHQNVTDASMHDHDDYGNTFILGRGNLTSITRCDAANSDEDTCNGGITSSTKYNTTGSVVSKTDPAGRVVKIGYIDNFSTNPSSPTYAYPTAVTDPGGLTLGAAGRTSTIKYRYDIGANVEATSPPPGDQTVGKTSKRLYDSVGRLQRDSIYVGSAEQAYTRYARPDSDNGLQLFTYSTLVDSDTTAGLSPGDEVMTEAWLDGGGRIWRSRQPHTFDSQGDALTWAATETVYDKIGRPISRSVPTEVNSSWLAAGEDSAYHWTHQRYDWMGRVIRKIATDGDPGANENNSDVFINYSTCGCAGGQITTIQGEKVQVPDQGSTLARRTTKIYADQMGRDFKTETFGWDGSTLYTGATSFFNGRDQVIEVQHTDYSDDPNDPEPNDPVTQITTAIYDGYGRLDKQRRPDQNANTYTDYNYNDDDSIESVTDARGAKVMYGYGMEKLPVFVQYDVPEGSNIEMPGNVAFTYDALGNRTHMQDALGNVDYKYNSLGQLTSESRSLNDIPTTPAINDNDKYTIGYSYHIGGQLKSYTDPNGREIKYAHDKMGRLNAVTGTLSSATTEYADNPHYRAWGALTHLDYGNGTEMNVGDFNGRFQATTFNVKKGSTVVMSKTYAFHNDGQVKLETDALNAKFNRSYMFDHVGRIQQARSGAEATGGTATAANIPYTNDFEYNGFGNQTKNEFTHYSRTGTVNDTYTNNKLSGGSYDSEGNQLMDPTFTAKSYYYDAANNLNKTSFEDFVNNQTIVQQEFLTYDGDGYQVKRATSVQADTDPADTDASYTLRSSLLKGEVISTVDKLGNVGATYVRANGTVVAVEGLASNPVWMHKDPNLKSLKSTDANGNLIQSGYMPDAVPKELDVAGNEAGSEDPYIIQSFDPDPGFIEPFVSFGNLTNGQVRTYDVDGMQVPKSQFDRMFDFAFQGYFGAIERQARLSVPRLSHLTVGNQRFSATLRGANRAAMEAIETGQTLVRHWTPGSQAWAVSLTLDPNVNPRFITHLEAEQSLANRILEIVYFARDSVDCTNAFKALSAVPIGEQIKNTTIVTESVFGNQKYDLSGWTGGDQYIGPYLRSIVASHANTADATIIGEFNNTGRRFIGLTNAGINESVDYLAAVIIHSFIHSGGIYGRSDVSNRWEDYIWGNDPAGTATRITPSDLHYRGDEYDAALDACIKGPKKTKAPRAKPYGIPTN